LDNPSLSIAGGLSPRQWMQQVSITVSTVFHSVILRTQSVSTGIRVHIGVQFLHRRDDFFIKRLDDPSLSIAGGLSPRQ